MAGSFFSNRYNPTQANLDSSGFINASTNALRNAADLIGKGLEGFQDTVNVGDEAELYKRLLGITTEDQFNNAYKDGSLLQGLGSVSAKALKDAYEKRVSLIKDEADRRKNIINNQFDQLSPEYAKAMGYWQTGDTNSMRKLMEELSRREGILSGALKPFQELNTPTTRLQLSNAGNLDATANQTRWNTSQSQIRFADQEFLNKTLAQFAPYNSGEAAKDFYEDLRKTVPDRQKYLVDQAFKMTFNKNPAFLQGIRAAQEAADIQAKKTNEEIAKVQAEINTLNNQKNDSIWDESGAEISAEERIRQKINTEAQNSKEAQDLRNFEANKQSAESDDNQKLIQELRSLSPSQVMVMYDRINAGPRGLEFLNKERAKQGLPPIPKGLNVRRAAGFHDDYEDKPWTKYARGALETVTPRFVLDKLGDLKPEYRAQNSDEYLQQNSNLLPLNPEDLENLKASAKPIAKYMGVSVDDVVDPIKGPKIIEQYKQKLNQQRNQNIKNQLDERKQQQTIVQQNLDKATNKLNQLKFVPKVYNSSNEIIADREADLASLRVGSQQVLGGKDLDQIDNIYTTFGDGKSGDWFSALKHMSENTIYKDADGKEHRIDPGKMLKLISDVQKEARVDQNIAAYAVFKTLSDKYAMNTAVGQNQSKMMVINMSEKGNLLAANKTNAIILAKSMNSPEMAQLLSMRGQIAYATKDLKAAYDAVNQTHNDLQMIRASTSGDPAVQATNLRAAEIMYSNALGMLAMKRQNPLFAYIINMSNRKAN